MIRRSDASEAQVRAAEPAQSTWLSANAGSGKTRVLTDRVARLLLDGCEPQRILCLTYTKAAAAEMQNRLFQRLGEWAMLPEPDLRAALRELGAEGRIDNDTLARARRLFARAIDTPGGLKIQTIHSFCASLLRRFPLEAGVSPDFREMEDRAAKLMRAGIVEELADGGDIDAVDAVASVMAGEDFDPLLQAIASNRAGFSPPLGKAAIWGLFGLPEGFGPDALLAQAFTGGEARLLAELGALMAAGKSTDIGNAARFAQIQLDPPDMAAILALESILLTGATAKQPFSAKVGTMPTKDLGEGPCAHLMPDLHDLMARIEAARDTRIALAAAEKTLALHRFAAAFLPRYDAAKAAHGWLDFDDLIGRAGALLSDRTVTQWVLYRLDGGIDHILVDEAQDTSPGQWKVIERLAEEFTAGEDARGRARTVFVVGDKKQSIYSFQGADLQEFDGMRAHFGAKFAQIGRPMLDMELRHSFRSSEAILRVVDLTMNDRVNHGLGGATSHLAFHDDRPGRVDLWPMVPKAEKPEPGDWFDPIDLIGDQHHTVRLARQIASELRRMIDAGTQIHTREGLRRMHEGDVLILVQRRSDLFAEIIRACKAAGLDVAGADRLKLGAELAVKDLAALLSFLALPEDDLSLACVLRSPLFGWTEAQLYDLAQPRGPKEYLWAALRDRTDHAETITVLRDLLDAAEFLRPYDLIERILTRHDGRRRLLARLGPEAQDGIDELLSQAMAFEQTQVPSLTGFLVWLETDEVEVKRQPDAAGRRVRVMTVHGAKGLEAPLVILPDTAKRTPLVRDEIYSVGQGHVIWKTSKADSPAITAAAREELEERQRQERMRLLYVAMTRAESWLIVCAAGDTGKGEDSWYGLIDEGMTHAGDVILPQEDADAMGFGPVRRVEHGHWPDDRPGEIRQTVAGVTLPDWAITRAPVPPQADAPLSPSGLGGAKVLPGEDALRDQQAALRYGSLLHLLLEHLPNFSAEEWPETAAALLQDNADLAEIEPLLAEARACLTAPAMQGLLGPDALVEVEVTASLPDLGNRLMRGNIDRLVVAPDHVLAVDYKSNAVVPASAAEVPQGILRQMGAYAAALAQIYPGRRIDTAILWTRTAQLMPLDPNIVRDALQSSTIP